MVVRCDVPPWGAPRCGAPPKPGFLLVVENGGAVRTSTDPLLAT